MMMSAVDDGEHSEEAALAGHPGDDQAMFSALLEDSLEDLYEHAPCGYLSTLLDGRIAKVNTTLLNWLGYQRGDLVGRKAFSDLLTVRAMEMKAAVESKDKTAIFDTGGRLYEVCQGCHAKFIIEPQQAAEAAAAKK